MRTFVALILILLLCTSLYSHAQDCKAYFPMKEGVSFEITSYDKKGKESSKALHTITNYEESGNEKIVDVTTEVMVEKQDEPFVFDYQAICEDGKFRMNRFGGMSSQQMAMSGTVDVKGDYLEIPSDPSEGQKLPDSQIIMTVNMDAGPSMNFTYNITNRMVEGYENVETPAGSYNALKISYDLSTKMVVSIQSKVAEWFVEGVGVVKSEQYNKKGKLQSYSLLTSIEGI